MSDKISSQIPIAVPENEAGEPVFKEPWEAKAFAMTLSLFQQGHYSWDDFRNHLIAEINADGDVHASGEAYYEHWFEAFEKLLAEKQLVSSAEIELRAAELAKPKK